MSAPDPINVVLPFRDSDGKKWLAGALMGPVCAEGDMETRIQVPEMIDRALSLVSFKVVHPPASASGLESPDD